MTYHSYGQDLGGEGGNNYFFKILKFPMRFANGVWGMLPREFF